jgi:hypothetical protein
VKDKSKCNYKYFIHIIYVQNMIPIMGLLEKTLEGNRERKRE